MSLQARDRCSVFSVQYRHGLQARHTPGGGVLGNGRLHLFLAIPYWMGRRRLVDPEVSSGLADCGRPDCDVCRLARVKVEASASTSEPMRKDARPEPKKVKMKALWMPKKRHRVGPHQ